MRRLCLFFAIMGFIAQLFSQGVLIQPGAYITVKSDAYLKTTGTAGLTIKSTSAGTGSLLDESGGVAMTGTGTIRAEQYLAKNAWHLVAPVTTGVTANNYYWNDQPKCWLMYHTESSNALTYNTNLATSMPVGQGWLVWIDNTTTSNPGATAIMTGSLRSTSLSPAVTKTGLGWNLVGNPFPSAIDWQSGNWIRTNLELTIWIWSNSDNNYLYRTTAGGGTMTNGIIPPGQGFFVKAIASSPALTIPDDSRTHSAQAFYKGTETDPGYADYIVIAASNNQQTDQVWVSFGPNGTDGFDNGFDASKLTGGETAPQLYLTEGSMQLSIDHLLTLGDAERIVSMAYKVGTAGVQSLTANTEYFRGKTVFLDDLVTGQTQNLLQNKTYLFSASVGDNPDRFRLRFRNALGVEDEPRQDTCVKIFGGEGVIYVHTCFPSSRESGTMQVYDMTGRLLLNTGLLAMQELTIPTILKGYLIVRIIRNSAQTTAKIFVR